MVNFLNYQYISHIQACGLHRNVDCDYRFMDAMAQYRIAMY